MATGTIAERDKEEGASREQLDAWSFYGLPKSFGQSSEIKRGRQVGEVRYIVGWASDQMSRMGWRVKIDGSESWRILPPGDGQETIVSDSGQEDTDHPEHPTQASQKLLQLVSWDESSVRQVTTNLYVAGELHYAVRVEDSKDVWEVVSVIHPDRKDLLKTAVHAVRGVFPHPAAPNDPDAPLFGVLPILEDMDWLNRLSRSQSSNRVGMRGILGVADGINVANGSGEDFWQDIEDMIHEPMKSPDDVGMAVFRGPSELIEQSGSGMKGLSLLIPNFPYDDKVDARMDKLVQRLAYGLPVPPEILLGMQAASRATAFQVEEQTYRAHIEPMAYRVATVPEQALALILSDVGDIQIEPDPTQILARRHSTQDVLEAFDRGAVSYEFLRETLGIPERGAATEGDLDWHKRSQGASATSETSPTTDPGNDAADERISGDPANPINASSPLVNQAELPPTFRRLLSEEIDPEEVTTLSELSEALEHIDATLLAELGGATQQSTERAREKLGAAVRSRTTSKSTIPADLTNAEVAAQLGEAGLAEVGVQIETVIRGAIDPLLSWWGGRVTGAQKTITKLLGDELAPEFTSQMVDESSEELFDLMTAHILGTLESPVAQALSAASRMGVISIAGGAGQ